MIPTAFTILQSYELYRRRHATGLASARAVGAALDAARALSQDEQDEPAALLFAFASYRRAFPGAWRFMAHAIAAQQARALGFELKARREDIDALFSSIMYRSTGFEEVRAWVAAHMVQPQA